MEKNFEDMPRRVPSLDKIRKAVGYEPRFTLDETLQSVISHLRDSAAGRLLGDHRCRRDGRPGRAAVTDGNAPRVTIGIPCFNQAEFLPECLDSLLAQTCSRWEAIVVDDASTKGDVVSVVEGYRDTRIRVMRHDVNKGPGAARNAAFSSGAADLLLALDGDDCLEPQFLSLTIDVLDRRQEVDCVFTDLVLFGRDGRMASGNTRDQGDGARTDHAWFRNGHAPEGLGTGRRIL